MALPQLFSIGEMAKIFHLSVSSLRHYEALGLVSPEYVDPSTNYRYYSVRQFEPLNTISKTAAEIIDAAAVPTREHERKQKIYSH